MNLPSAVEQVVAHLIRDQWCQLLARTQLRWRKVRDSNVPHLSGIACANKNLHRFKEWHVHIRPVDHPHVKVIGPKSTQLLVETPGSIKNCSP